MREYIAQNVEIAFVQLQQDAGKLVFHLLKERLAHSDKDKRKKQQLLELRKGSWKNAFTGL